MRTLLRSALTVTLFLAAACGGSDLDGRQGPAEPPPEAPVRSVAVDRGVADVSSGAEAKIVPAPLSRTPFLGARPSSRSAALDPQCTAGSPSSNCR